MDIGLPETEQEIEIMPLEEPAHADPGREPREEPVPLRHRLRCSFRPYGLCPCGRLQ